MIPSVAVVLGLSGCVVILIASLWRRDWRSRRMDLVATGLFAAYLPVGAKLLELEERLRGATCDPALLRADRALGFDTLGFWAWTRGHARLFGLLLLVYVLLSP